MKKILVLLIILFLISSLGSAFALMPPYTKGELEKESTHIIQAKVLGAAFIDKYKSKSNNREYEYSRYSAWVVVEKSYKGDLKKNDTIQIKWTWRKLVKKETGFIDESYHNPAYYPGEVIKTHLKKYTDYYDSVWWNAKEYIKNTGKDLPSELGQVVYGN